MQRDALLEPFLKLGCAMRPLGAGGKEMLLAFASMAQARRALTIRRAQYLRVQLLEQVTPASRRRELAMLELAPPPRNTDASTASRLITASLGIRRPRGATPARPAARRAKPTDEENSAW